MKRPVVNSYSHQISRMNNRCQVTLLTSSLHDVAKAVSLLLLANSYSEQRLLQIQVWAELTSILSNTRQSDQKQDNDGTRD